MDGFDQPLQHLTPAGVAWDEASPRAGKHADGQAIDVLPWTTRCAQSPMTYVERWQLTSWRPAMRAPAMLPAAGPRPSSAKRPEANNPFPHCKSRSSTG